jgi:hypothetical protein
MHTLLNTNKDDDILCVQEPWFNRIGVARCDDKINGKDVLGGAANPQWELFYPYFSSSQRAKVMVYHQIHNRSNPFRKNHLRVTVRNDLVAHPSIMMVEVWAGTELWRVINFYNDIDDPSTIRTLLRLDLPSTIPTLLVGDFNVHSPSWSPQGWSASPHAIPLEEWCATQTLSLLSVPRVVTHCGESGARDSTIDLVWHNFTADLRGIFSTPTIDWAGSLSSDHALIHIATVSSIHVKQPREDRTNRFHEDVDDASWMEWRGIVKAHAPSARTPIHLEEDLNATVEELYSAFNEACTHILKQKGMAPAHSSHWWNDECREAAKRC